MVDVKPLLKILNVAFLLFLISACFINFSLPSIKKFLEYEVIIHESVEKHKALRPPAITICPKKWKPKTEPMIDNDNYETHCGNSSTSEDFMGCVTNKTYGRKEMIGYARRGVHSVVEDFIDYVDPQLWTWDLTFATLGRCYTLNYDQLLKPNPLTDGIFLQLVNHTDSLYLSGPGFNFTTANPLMMPVTFVTLHGIESGTLSVILKMVKTEELNRVEAP